jgi:hypothetical protein
VSTQIIPEQRPPLTPFERALTDAYDAIPAVGGFKELPCPYMCRERTHAYCFSDCPEGPRPYVDRCGCGSPVACTCDCLQCTVNRALDRRRDTGHYPVHPHQAEHDQKWREDQAALSEREDQAVLSEREEWQRRKARRSGRTDSLRYRIKLDRLATEQKDQDYRRVMVRDWTPERGEAYRNGMSLKEIEETLL